MTVHLCRDLLTHASASSPATNMYFLALFCRHVLSYDIHSSVNFDITSSLFLKGEGSLASINDSGTDYDVVFPASYTVSAADVGRILALRSETNPKHNSGLFRILSVNVPGNFVTVDYRSSEYPPDDNSLFWRVFESELNVTSSWTTGSNGTSGYASKGSSTASRIALTARAGWNLRLCLESIPDRSGTIPCGFSIAPGMGITGSVADYDQTAGHLHGAMWFDTREQLHRGLTVGLSPNTNVFEHTRGQWRFSAIGDSDSGTVAAFTRNVSFSSGGNGWTVFGLADDVADTSSDLIDELFVIGYGNALPNLTWHSGFFNDGHAQGVAWSGFGFPAPCVMSSYADVRNLDPHVRGLSTATDSVLAGGTELLDVELLCGTMTGSLTPLTSSAVPFFAPRRVGRLPFVRQGRSNYSSWSTSSDKAWLHVSGGIFIPWMGPLTVDSATGSFVLPVVTSSLSDELGIVLYESNPPMEDPPTDSVTILTASFIVDRDATRYKKMYSYYRQPTSRINVTKGGSNRGR